MSTILKELAQLKGYFHGGFKFENIPRYFSDSLIKPPLTRSWEVKQGYTDVYVGGELHGFPGKRMIRNLFVCYRPFYKILPSIEKKINDMAKNFTKETKIPIKVTATSYYKNFDTVGPGLFIQQTNEDYIPLDLLINFLEKVEMAIVENVSIAASNLRKKP